MGNGEIWDFPIKFFNKVAYIFVILTLIGDSLITQGSNSQLGVKPSMFAPGFAWWRWRKPQEQFFDVPAEEDPEVHLGQLKRFSLRELQVAAKWFSPEDPSP